MRAGGVAGVADPANRAHRGRDDSAGCDADAAQMGVQRLDALGVRDAHIAAVAGGRASWPTRAIDDAVGDRQQQRALIRAIEAVPVGGVVVVVGVAVVVVAVERPPVADHPALAALEGQAQQNGRVGGFVARKCAEWACALQRGAGVIRAGGV